VIRFVEKSLNLLEAVFALVGVFAYSREVLRLAIDFVYFEGFPEPRLFETQIESLI
jgi:hypothetical protein